MKTYYTQAEVEADIKNGVLVIEGDVRFDCNISIRADIIVTNGNIKAWDINAYNINAWDINAYNIKAVDIKAWDINAYNINAVDINAKDIKAWDINAYNINAVDINAYNIKAVDIKAWDINAKDISYYALCIAYDSITCTSIKPKRAVHQKPICLDGKLTIIEKEDDATEQAIQLLKSNGYKIIKD